MRTYDEAFVAARTEPPFSNGTEGDGWMDAWCYQCTNDGNHEDTGCPLVLIAMLGKTPMEWLDGPRDEQGRYGIEDRYHCIEFRGEDDGQPPDPTPIPDPPGQGLLLPREPFEAVRMYGGAHIRQQS